MHQKKNIFLHIIFVVYLIQDELRFITRVYDDDSDPNDITPNDDANDDLVSTIKGIFIVSTSDRFTPIYELSGLFNKIQIDFHMYCAANYFGSQCSVFCEPMDGERGHYTCDSQGNIVCLEGYLGKETNCTTCEQLIHPFIYSSIHPTIPFIYINAMVFKPGIKLLWPYPLTHTIHATSIHKLIICEPDCIVYSPNKF